MECHRCVYRLAAAALSSSLDDRVPHQHVHSVGREAHTLFAARSQSAPRYAFVRKTGIADRTSAGCDKISCAVHVESYRVVLCAHFEPKLSCDVITLYAGIAQDDTPPCRHSPQHPPMHTFYTIGGASVGTKQPTKNHPATYT